MKYELQATKKFERAFRKLSTPVSNHIKKEALTLASHPRKGEPLRHELKGLWSLHTKFKNTHYRTIYTISDRQKIIYLHYVNSRENIYKQVRRLKIKTD